MLFGTRVLFWLWWCLCAVSASLMVLCLCYCSRRLSVAWVSLPVAPSRCSFCCVVDCVGVLVHCFYVWWWWESCLLFFFGYIVPLFAQCCVLVMGATCGRTCFCGSSSLANAFSLLCCFAFALLCTFFGGVLPPSVLGCWVCVRAHCSFLCSQKAPSLLSAPFGSLFACASPHARTRCSQETRSHALASTQHKEINPTREKQSTRHKQAPLQHHTTNAKDTRVYGGGGGGGILHGEFFARENFVPGLFRTVA